ncbi:ergot alkaloid B [Aspergillus sclerotiicarbonarius CBS 121057]|uniref:4-dimethylallyltryptophan N-methyltransferase n=1 Tax=Aspergillus sclerotiicarbonarius (strain CBS 121057 / IBT 28362) TaxID=1448318 RepID=A0A319ENC2_ASPSB|nr:ergot alkaloid B [Aspergillus sclerotiicarbonarius CBS 121057]
MAKSIVLDIRQFDTEDSIRDWIIEGISKNPKELPSLILYSAQGLQHWACHSSAPSYYLRQEEMCILKSEGDEIAKNIPDGGVIVDFGSAALEKVMLLLEALERQAKNVTYYALDVSQSELVSTLKTIPMERYNHVRFAGLYGTFDDGLHWLKEDPNVRDLPHCVMFLGSSIGNFSKPEAAGFLSSITTNALRSPGSSVLIGIDGCKEPLKVLRAYTADGVGEFTMAGLEHANSILEQRHVNGEVSPSPSAFNLDDWYYLTEWNHQLGRQEASYIPRSKDIRLGPPLDDIVVKKGERIRFAVSQKYDAQERRQLFDEAGLQEVSSWSNSDCDLGELIPDFCC